MKKSNWKPMPLRFRPFDRKTTPPREVVQHLVRNEVHKLMQADRKAGLEWSSYEGNCAFRYLKAQTHGGDALDYSGLKFHQLIALQRVFMTVCFFEEKRSLANGACLPGMCSDWYAEFFDEVAESGRRAIREAKANSTEKKVYLDNVLKAELSAWYTREHLPEVKFRLAIMAEQAEAITDDAMLAHTS